MPAKVSLSARATVMAGFAKDVDEVNQYAAPIHPVRDNYPAGGCQPNPRLFCNEM